MRETRETEKRTHGDFELAVRVVDRVVFERERRGSHSPREPRRRIQIDADPARLNESERR